jgi:hypothetical protein
MPESPAFIPALAGDEHGQVCTGIFNALDVARALLSSISHQRAQSIVYPSAALFVAGDQRRENSRLFFLSENPHIHLLIV